jgi:multidrug efflux pump subunit AcrA (membrane-fusion protein)
MTPLQKTLSLSFAAIPLLAIPSLAFVFGPGNEVDDANSEANKADIVPLPVATFVLGEIKPPIQMHAYRGVVVPSKEAELGFRRGGRIESLFVEEGSEVQQQQVLAKLDSSDVRFQLATTRSQVAEAEAVLAELIAGPRSQTISAARSEVLRLSAALSLSRATAERQQNLLKSNASSVQQFDEARFAVQQNEAALESAKYRLDELLEGSRKEQIAAQEARIAVLQGQVAALEVDLADTQIVAPFSGIISRRYLDEGAITGPQSVALRLICCSPLEARFGISVADAKRLRLGESVMITVGERTFDSLITRIEPELDLSSRTQTIYVTFPNDCRADIVPGETASLAMVEEQGDALWIPISALSRAARGLWTVYAVSDTGVVERREVQVVETDTELARVAGTMITRGERLVSGGLHRITPGMKVSYDGSDLK